MRLPTPSNRSRFAYRLNRSTAAVTGPGLQGSATPGSAGGAVVNGTTYSEVVAVAASAKIRVRIKTATATGTLNIKPVGPMGLTSTDESAMALDGFVDPAKVLVYTTGVGTVAVTAGTEVKLDLDLYGESYVLVEFVCSLTGSIVFCDVCQV